MDELYLKTENGNIPLDPAIIEKYNLKSGEKSPLTRMHIVDKNSKQDRPQSIKERNSLEPLEQNLEEKQEGEVFTTSEILDIAQGVDSAVEGDKDTGAI